MEFDPTGISLVALFGAILFAAVAKFTRQAWFPRLISGALTGWFVGTVTIGLAHATAVPYVKSVVSTRYAVGAAIAILILLALAASMALAAKVKRKNQGGV